MKYGVFLLLVLMLALNLAPAHAQDSARLRVIHAVSDAPAVDIYVDGVLVGEEIAFGDATPHYILPAGAHRVEARAGDAVLLAQNIDTPPDLAFSLVLEAAAGAVVGSVYEDVLDPLAPGLARLAIVHARAGGDPVDIMRADGAPLMLGVSYGVPYGTINIPAGAFELIAVPTGGTAAESIADFGQLNLLTNTLYTLVLTEEGFVLPSPTQSGADTSLVRLVHAAAAGTVDLYLDDTLIASGVSAGSASPHVPLPQGDHTLSLRGAGSPPNSEAVFSAEVTIDAPALTLAVVSDEDELAVLTLLDDIAGLSSSKARLQILNLSAPSVNLSLDSGETLADDLAAGTAGAPVDVDPGDYQITGDIEGEASFAGGILYTLLATADDFIPAQTLVDLQLSSLPGAEVAAAPVAEETEAAPAAPAAEETEAAPAAPVAEETAAPTLPPTVAPAEAAPVLPTPIVATPEPPVVQPAEVAVQPTVPPPPPVQPGIQARPTKPGIYPPVDVIFGVVALNQGVNLQCREYPTSQARSLGLIPNGTELTVHGLFAPRDETGEIGRFDALLIEGIPDFSPLLEDDFTIDDFDQTMLDGYKQGDLWLNIDWIVQDGTPFGCWVNAAFVQINYRNFLIDQIREYLELVEGLNLDLTPYNVPGGPRDPDTVINPQVLSAPTPLPAATLQGTVNVNRGVNLQLRRTPGVTGESLALVPGGSALSVIAQTSIPVTGVAGEPTVPEWLYAEYAQPTGLPVRGWVSAEYIILTLGGRTAKLEDVPVAEEIEQGGFVDPEGFLLPESGATGGTVPQSAPAAAPQNQIMGRLMTDPGTTLNLRAEPSLDGQIRASVPWDATVTVVGRSGNGEWVEVVYTSATGSTQGWMAATLVFPSLNDAPYTIKQLTITDGAADTMP